MKTQLSKPARSHARYTEEYKKEALELWRASGRSAAKVAAELGIRAPLLYRISLRENHSSGFSESRLADFSETSVLSVELREQFHRSDARCRSYRKRRVE